MGNDLLTREPQPTSTLDASLVDTAIARAFDTPRFTDGAIKLRRGRLLAGHLEQDSGATAALVEIDKPGGVNPLRGILASPLFLWRIDGRARSCVREISLAGHTISGAEPPDLDIIHQPGEAIMLPLVIGQESEESLTVSGLLKALGDFRVRRTSITNLESVSRQPQAIVAGLVGSRAVDAVGPAPDHTPALHNPHALMPGERLGQVPLALLAPYLTAA